MEIKEINNSLLNLLQMNKTPVQSGNATAMGFGDILAELETANAGKADVKADFSQAKKQVSTQFSENKSQETDSYDKTSSSDTDKVSASKKDNAFSKQNEKTVNKADNKQEDKTSVNKSTDKTDSKENPESKTEDKTTIKDKNQQEIVSVANDSATKEDLKVAPSEDIATNDVVETQSQTKEISVEALSLLGTVAVVNPLDGTQMQVSGQDLATALSSQGIESVSLTEGENSQLMLVVPEENSSEFNAFQEALQSFEVVADGAEVQPLKAQTATKEKGEELVATDAENTNLVDEQASQLSEVSGNRKLKVEVNVKEEKIADKVDGSLVKESKLSENTLSAIMSGDDQSNPLTETKTPAANMANNAQTVQSQTSQAKLAGVAVAQNTAAIATTDDTASLSLDNNTTTLAQVGSLGRENIPTAKLAANDAQNTSFRDVYKGMSKEVIDQVKVNITKSAVKGVDKVEIQLKPEDLGHIEVKMQIGKDGKLQAHIVASRPETAEMLQKDISSLQKAFNDAGFQTDEGSLSFSFRNEGQSNGEQEKNNLRNFIGQALEQETAMDAAGNDMLYSGNLNGTNGLNIRV